MAMTSVVLLLVALAALAGGAALVVVAVGRPAYAWSDSTTARLAWASVGWTVAVALVVLFAPLTSRTTGVSMSGNGEPKTIEWSTSHHTLLEQEGRGLLVVVAVPVVVGLVGAVGRGATARPRRITAGWVLMVGSLLGAASIGSAVIPAALALLVAGLRTRRPTASGFGTT
jgi:hypothetical protein